MNGYIVVCEMGTGGPMVLLERDNSCWKNIPQGGVLLLDTRTATVFPSRKSAKEAITRTEKYRPHHHWPDDAYRILRLVHMDERKGGNNG